MKKLLIVLILISSAFFSCDNHKKSNKEVGKDTETYRQVGVDNVNGNIPDTSDAINLSTKKVDSSEAKTDSSLIK
jgi:hypothetical protein